MRTPSTPPWQPRPAAVLGITTTLLAACGAVPGAGAESAEAGARRTFSQAFTCPMDRITATPVEDSPPAEVARDPERLALWQSRRDGQDRVFDVQGCDRRSTLACQTGEPAFCLPRVRSLGTSGTDSLEAAVNRAAALELQRTAASGDHGRLGILMTEVTGTGMVVIAVQRGSPADGKLQTGDLIVQAGGEAVPDKATLLRIVKARAGMSLDLTIRRGSEQRSVTVYLGS